MADRPLSARADPRFHEAKRLPGALGVIGVGLVVALLVTIYGTFRWGWTWTGYQDKDNASLWGWLDLVLLPVTIALLPLWLRSRERRKASWRVGLGVVVLVFAVLVVGGYRGHWGWTGFEGNTLWDWLKLLLVPFALPVVIAWATTPPPTPTPDAPLAPDARQQQLEGEGPVTGVLGASAAENAAGMRPHATRLANPAEPDATDPGTRLVTRRLPAPMSRRHPSAATGQGHQPPPTAPQPDRPSPPPRAGSAPPAGRQPTTAEPATAGVAPADSAPARLVQAHPALTIATSLTLIGVLFIAALLPGRAPHPSTATTQTVTVSSKGPWTDTGIYLTKGEPVTIAASGQVDHDGPSRGSPPAGPDGDPQARLRKYNVLWEAPHAALIGELVGSTQGHPFLIGSHYHTEGVDQAGLLLLGVNDHGRTNNTGVFTARIEVARR
jgi:hypothetical protein